jgi:hypothetical protein
MSRFGRRASPAGMAVYSKPESMKTAMNAAPDTAEKYPRPSGARNASPTTLALIASTPATASTTSGSTFTTESTSEDRAPPLMPAQLIAVSATISATPLAAGPPALATASPNPAATAA